MKIRLVILIAALVVFASLGPGRAASNLGGSGFGFSCDVNTQQCRCDGVETGADCQAMKKNCGSNPLNCFKDLNYKDICICTMGLKKRLPNLNNAAPKLKEAAPQ